MSPTPWKISIYIKKTHSHTLKFLLSSYTLCGILHVGNVMKTRHLWEINTKLGLLLTQTWQRSFAWFGPFTLAKWCSVYRWAARVVLISDSFPLFQGIPGVHGKKGKMGRPVKFSLNILHKNEDVLSWCLDSSALTSYFEVYWGWLRLFLSLAAEKCALVVMWPNVADRQTCVSRLNS